MPFVELTLNPGVKLDALKLVGVLLPVMVYVNGTPIWARAILPLVTEGATAAAAIVIVSVFVLFPPAFVAVNVTVMLPAVVGVPLITPVVAFTINPAGRGVAL